jgi:hypothetical protein
MWISTASDTDKLKRIERFSTQVQKIPKEYDRLAAARAA